MENSYTSLCVNARKGDSTNGEIFEYSGGRVNEFVIGAEIDETVKATAAIVCKDSTVTSNDVSSALSLTAGEPLTFENGRLSVETAFASLTTTSYWHIQSAKLTVNNNLKTDNEARRIGSDVLQVLPVGVADLKLTMTVRFDTTTAYDAMINGTQLAAELEFLGTTLSTSIIRRGLKFQMPKLYIDDAGDPEIGGPDEILSSEITCSILKDISSTSGYAIRALVTNSVANYD